MVKIKEEEMKDKKWLKYLMGVVVCLLLLCVAPITTYAADEYTFTFIPYADAENTPLEELLKKESQLNNYAVGFYLNDELVAEGNTFSCNKSDLTEGDILKVVLYDTQTGEKEVRYTYKFKVFVASNGNINLGKVYNDYGVHLANVRYEGKTIYVVPKLFYSPNANGGDGIWGKTSTAYSLKIVDTEGNPLEGYTYIGNSVFNMEYDEDGDFCIPTEDVVTSNENGYFGTDQVLNELIVHMGGIPYKYYYYDDGFLFVNDENKADKGSRYGGLLRDTYPSYLDIEPDKERIAGYVNMFGSHIRLITENASECKDTFSIKDTNGNAIGTVDVYAKDNAFVEGGLLREEGKNFSIRIESNLTEEYSVSYEYVGERSYVDPIFGEISDPTFEIVITFNKPKEPENTTASTDEPKTDAVYTAEEFDQLLAKNADSDVVIKSSDNVTMSFAKGTMKKVDGVDTYDFTSTMSIDSGTSKLPASVKADKFVAKITYNYSGKLPAEATVKILVGTKYSGKDVYYSLFNGDGKLTEMKKATVDKNGYMTVKQSHCSDWIITTSDPTQEENAGANDSPVVDNSTTVTSPKTGDVNKVWTDVVLFMGVVLTFVGIVKSKKVMR